MKPLRIDVRYQNRATRSIALAAILWTHGAVAPPASAHDDFDCRPGGNTDCGQHNMMLVGKEAAFISHLPMFHNEHRFQVIAKVRFADAGQDLDPLYGADREDHPEIRMYTVRPNEQFVLSRLFLPETGPDRGSFNGTVFRDHLERGGQEIEGLRGISLEIEEVVFASEITVDDGARSDLQYILFGSGNDLYLAHVISGAPDFDQIVAVSLGDDDLTAGSHPNGTIVTIPDRANTASERLRADERVSGEVRVPGIESAVPLKIEVGAEYYFEEGELFVPPTFSPTELERDAGF